MINQDRSVFDIFFRCYSVMFEENEMTQLLSLLLWLIKISVTGYSVHGAWKRMQRTRTLGYIHWHLPFHQFAFSSLTFYNPSKTFTSFEIWKEKLNLLFIRLQIFWLNKIALWYLILESEIRKISSCLSILTYHSYEVMKRGD